MRCVFPNCNNNSSKTSQGITYHIFPTEPSLRAAWLEALRMSDWEPEERSVVCSCHFQQQDLLSSAEPIRDARVCRICFATDCEQYPMTANESLCKAYETLTGLSIQNDVNLPQHVCSECACRLLNYTRFRATSLRAHSVLLDVVSNYGYITLELLQSVKGVQSQRSSSQTDYGLAGKENIYPEEQGFAADGIKTKDDIEISQDNVCDDDTTVDDKMFIFTLDKNIVKKDNYDILRIIADIKAENEKVISQDNVETEHINKNDISCLANLHSKVAVGGVNIAVNSINAENDEEISQGDSNSENTPNDAICIKVENDCVMNENSAVEQQSTNSYEYLIDVEVKPGNLFVGEYPSSDDSELLAEKKQNDKQITVEMEEVSQLSRSTAQEKVTVRRHREADGGHLVDSKFSCNICPYQTFSEIQFLAHSKAHAASVSYSCNTCSYITTRNGYLKRHLKSHSGEKQFSCDMCPKVFSYKCNLKTHLSTHTDEKTFSCDICSRAFYQERSLTAHMSIHSGEKRFPCPTCNKAFYQKRSLTVHMNTHAAENRFSCTFCHKDFYQRRNLIAHMSTHTGEKRFSCDICNKAFYHKGRLIAHMSTHIGKKTFLCDVCNKAFYHKGSLAAHMTTHTGEKRFSCGICNKAFYKKFCLKTHMNTHTGVKQFSCGICNKAFYQKGSLTRHMSTHTGEKRFSCDVCNKAFYKKGGLIEHMNTHTGEKRFSCHICNKAFNHKSSLTAHGSTHTGEKRFPCNTCNKAFDKKCRLTEHISTHTGEKGFSCSICSKAFYQKGSLRKHASIHTGEK